MVKCVRALKRAALQGKASRARTSTGFSIFRTGGGVAPAAEAAGV